jgi:hypothetical protein
MKAELIHLLEELAGPRCPEGFQALSFNRNGSAIAFYRWGTRQFPDLAALEKWLYEVNREGELHREHRERNTESAEVKP